MPTTGKTCLRPLERRDLAITRIVRADPDVARATMGRRFPITDANEEAWFEGLGRGAFPDAAVWAIAAVDGDRRILGLVQVVDIDWVHRTAWFGIWVDPTSQRQGHGEAATRMACRYAACDLGLRQLRLRVLADNRPAIAVYLRAGFVQEGLMSGAVLVDGAPVDLVIMRLDLEDLAEEARRSTDG